MKESDDTYRSRNNSSFSLLWFLIDRLLHSDRGVCLIRLSLSAHPTRDMVTVTISVKLKHNDTESRED